MKRPMIPRDELPLKVSLELGANTRHGDPDVALDELGLEPRHAKPAESKGLVAKPIVVAPRAVHDTVDLDDQANRGRKEVGDEAAEQDLPPEPSTSRPGSNCGGPMRWAEVAHDTLAITRILSEHGVAPRTPLRRTPAGPDALALAQSR